MGGARYPGSDGRGRGGASRVTDQRHAAGCPVRQVDRADAVEVNGGKSPPVTSGDRLRQSGATREPLS